FTLPEQLLEIPGIGPKTFNRIRPFICVKVAP
ncbi:helix-hairpin-helix domain-containing protein, partial [bacterium]|nr:helix-hairpin-helix domain-containing protein [bacterium]